MINIMRFFERNRKLRMKRRPLFSPNEVMWDWDFSELHQLAEAIRFFHFIESSNQTDTFSFYTIRKKHNHILPVTCVTEFVVALSNQDESCLFSCTKVTSLIDNLNILDKTTRCIISRHFGNPGEKVKLLKHSQEYVPLRLAELVFQSTS